MEDIKVINGHRHIQYSRPKFQEEEVEQRSRDYFEFINERRSVRNFSSRKISRSTIENIVKTAGCAPSGANKQPWTYCIVEDAGIKKEIRIAAEKEEKVNYSGRMSDSWLKDLESLGTDAQKPFLENAPYLIIIFKKSYNLESESQKKTNNYYVNESVGLSAGFLLTAIHNAGLVALTHTPSPMNFLSKILKRPKNEKPFLLIPVGYPAEKCYVPEIKRKESGEFIKFY